MMWGDFIVVWYVQVILIESGATTTPGRCQLKVDFESCTTVLANLNHNHLSVPLKALASNASALGPKGGPAVVLQDLVRVDSS